ncbi:hypothetical protein MPRG_61250 (plasmid) [Mycobacterium paragordonae]|uniref:DUF559 domain-containing protein n=1 Tax=Mycobacterium paragordonae TaxID=1389713 RepID=A0ABQ1CEL4_9MYCO|nr:hypothetical protein MPRG_61250 [Mycobacterium paragordonae]
MLERRQDHAAAGVVDQNIDMAERLDSRGHQVVGRTWLVEFSDEAAGDGRVLIHAFQVLLGAGRRENRGAILD